MAARSRVKKSELSANAFGGKLNARAALKWVSPAKITHAIVPNTPTHNNLDGRPMMVIRRYSNATASAQVPIATKVPLVTSSRNSSGPRPGTFAMSVRENHVRCSGCQMYAAYCASPTHPEAMESGALNESCHIKRKEEGMVLMLHKGTDRAEPNLWYEKDAHLERSSCEAKAESKDPAPRVGSNHPLTNKREVPRLRPPRRASLGMSGLI